MYWLLLGIYTSQCSAFDCDFSWGSSVSAAVSKMSSSGNLVSATVSQRASWCSTQQVNEVLPTVPYLNVGGPITAVWAPVKADLPGDLSVCHSGVISVYPTSGTRVASIYGNTRCWHFPPRSFSKTVPTGFWTVTFHRGSGPCRFPVGWG